MMVTLLPADHWKIQYLDQMCYSDKDFTSHKDVRVLGSRIQAPAMVAW